MAGAAASVVAGRASGQPLRELSVGLASSSFATVAPRIAKEMGFFARHGINPRFVVMDSAGVATTALISRSVDCAVAGPGELIIAQARGRAVVSLAYIYRGLSGSLVLSKAAAETLGVPPGAPVAQRLKALDDVVIASAGATGANAVAFRGAAKSVGAAIRFTFMAQPAMVAALESGAIQGFNGGAPFWAVPVVKGTAVLWISGPRGDLPAQFTPTSTGTFQVMREFAEANPALVAGIKAAFSDLAATIEHRPAEVKAVVAGLYPDIDAPTLDLLFATESVAWAAVPPTAAELAHEIAFVKSAGDNVPGIDGVVPEALFF